MKYHESEEMYLETILLLTEKGKEVIKEIAVNQIAYGVNDEKIAVIKEFGGKMYLVNADTNEAVFEAEAKGPIFDNTNEINVANMNKGVYVVRIINGNQATTKKINL